MTSNRIQTKSLNRDQVDAAFDEWQFNCGPGALCAVFGMTPEEIRPHLGDFESKGYTNPTLMQSILAELHPNHRRTYRGDNPMSLEDFKEKFPDIGLVRIQFAGRWTEPGVPMRVRYRETHWIAVARKAGRLAIFDVNAVSNNGGWIKPDDWVSRIMPWLTESIEGANGEWWPTHIYELIDE